MMREQQSNAAGACGGSNGTQSDATAGAGNGNQAVPHAGAAVFDGAVVPDAAGVTDADAAAVPDAAPAIPDAAAAAVPQAQESEPPAKPAHHDEYKAGDKQVPEANVTIAQLVAEYMSMMDTWKKEAKKKRIKIRSEDKNKASYASSPFHLLSFHGQQQGDVINGSSVEHIKKQYGENWMPQTRTLEYVGFLCKLIPDQEIFMDGDATDVPDMSLWDLEEGPRSNNTYNSDESILSVLDWMDMEGAFLPNMFGLVSGCIQHRRLLISLLYQRTYTASHHNDTLTMN
ncbi:hypothetical protein RIF29_40671 [Crotalaria pallida]|uniref:Uncharacterized protein n=1 Tax=Crotalaria pallida TaxID=3830 RepID=A0AAN9HQU5_CROPI